MLHANQTYHAFLFFCTDKHAGEFLCRIRKAWKFSQYGSDGLNVYGMPALHYFASGEYEEEKLTVLCPFFHLLAHRLNIIFFCYDVVCSYWSFAKKVSELGRLGKIKNDLNQMISTMPKCFLSYRDSMGRPMRGFVE